MKMRTLCAGVVIVAGLAGSSFGGSNAEQQ